MQFRQSLTRDNKYCTPLVIACRDVQCAPRSLPGPEQRLACQHHFALGPSLSFQMVRVCSGKYVCVSAESISVTGAWVMGCVGVAMDTSLQWQMLVWLLNPHHHSASFSDEFNIWYMVLKLKAINRKLVYLVYNTRP